MRLLPARVDVAFDFVVESTSLCQNTHDLMQEQRLEMIRLWLLTECMFNRFKIT